MLVDERFEAYIGTAAAKDQAIGCQSDHLCG